MPLSEGQTFAGYRIVRLLGSGGVGEVYLAQHPRLPRRDALKVLHAEVSADPDYRERFIREADLAAKLWHPNIVGVHDRGECAGQLWIAMDYVAGTNAADLLRDRYPDGMPADQVIKIVTAVASALDYAHKQGLLHRDVKPANIMLTHVDDDEDEQRVLLTDFGIARAIDDISGLTATNMTVGTVAYAAPEQLMGEEIDGRADQYALAASTYNMLTDSQLFPHSNPAVVISRHLNAVPPALADTRPELAGLDPVLAIALAKNANDRFPSCTNFAHTLALAHFDTVSRRKDLGQAATLPALGTQPATTLPRKVSAASLAPVVEYSAREAPQRGGSRKRWLIMVTALGAILLVGVVAIAVTDWPRKRGRETSGTTNAPTSVTPSITFDAMRDFVAGYYDDLPAHPQDAWAKLDTHYQNQTGLHEYLDFWATIQSVTLISVGPRDTTSVIAQLRYVRQNGQSDTEDRWLNVVLKNGLMLIYDSGLIGSTGTPTPSPSPITTATQLVTAVAVDAKGQPINGYREGPPNPDFITVQLCDYPSGRL